MNLQEQNQFLECIFTEIGCPAADLRRSVSTHLGIEERCIKNWFQNRRARGKAQRTLNASSASRELTLAASPESDVPTLTQGYEPHLWELLHEPTPITIIPCSELAIGAWRRTATNPALDTGSSTGSNLIAYYSESTHVITWFINDSVTGYVVKMDIPFASILDMHISSFHQHAEATPENPFDSLAKVTFILAYPPLFFVETAISAIVNNGLQFTETTKVWTPCQDWTVDSQASAVLQHEVVGPAGPLKYLLENVIRPAIWANLGGNMGFHNLLPIHGTSFGRHEVLAVNDIEGLVPPCSTDDFQVEFSYLGS